jgi:hypothetical protein
MRVLQIGGNIYRVDTDQRAFEVDLPRNDAAELTFYQFVYA